MNSIRPYAVVLDVTNLDRMVKFWSELLQMKVTEHGSDWATLEPLGFVAPALGLQRVSEAKTVKNRMHFDLAVRDVEAEGDRAQFLGAVPASPLHQGEGRSWRVWRDPEGNEFCLVSA